MNTEPTEPDERVDETLRDAFAIDDPVARRVSDRALAAPQRHDRRAPLVASLAIAGAVVCAVAMTWLSRAPVPPSPVATPPEHVTELTASLVDGVLIVPIPGDVTVIAGPDQRVDRPADGTGIVVLEGDAR